LPVGSKSNHPTTFEESTERPLYTTNNLLHLDTGNPTFGDVSLVMRPSYAQAMALISPLDTG
jgi:hypothetical protein